MPEAAGGLAYGLYASDNQARAAGYVNVGGGDRAAFSPTDIPAGTWTHLAVTFDGSSLRLYVDGTLARTTAVSGAIRTTTRALRIGGNAVWGEWFSGTIDEVNVYDRALTSAEIAQDMGAA